jgi:hypothetical protein
MTRTAPTPPPADDLDISAARHLAEQAVQVTRQLGDDRLISRALAALRTACHYAGEPETGRPFGRSLPSEPAASATTS